LILPDRAVPAFHIAVKGRFEHHHERAIETMPQLPQCISKHQSFKHFVDPLQLGCNIK
jgi:hypothetical protein